MLIIYRRKGFTLIELLIVIAIIGILAAIAIPMFRAQMIKARMSEVITAIQYVKSASSTFYQNNDRWPDCSVSFASIRNTLDVQVPQTRISAMTAQGDPFVISTTLNNISASNPTIDGSTLVMVGEITGDGAITWSWDTSTSTLAAPFMPRR
jgi:prepilin-type N-terminal cleavage/methylation domain-containing protein